VAVAAEGGRGSLTAPACLQTPLVLLTAKCLINPPNVPTRTQHPCPPKPALALNLLIFPLAAAYVVQFIKSQSYSDITLPTAPIAAMLGMLFKWCMATNQR